MKIDKAIEIFIIAALGYYAVLSTVLFILLLIHPQVRSKDLIGGTGSEAVDDEKNLNKEKDDGSE